MRPIICIVYPSVSYDYIYNLQVNLQNVGHIAVKSHAVATQCLMTNRAGGANYCWCNKHTTIGSL